MYKRHIFVYDLAVGRDVFFPNVLHVLAVGRCDHSTVLRVLTVVLLFFFTCVARVDCGTTFSFLSVRRRDSFFMSYDVFCLSVARVDCGTVVFFYMCCAC